MSTISALANALPILPPLSPTAVNNSKMNTNSSTPSGNSSMMKSTNSLANNPNSTPSSSTNNNQSSNINLPSTTNTPNASQTNSSALSSAVFVEEKVYKKEKQILLEFDSKTKGKLFKRVVLKQAIDIFFNSKSMGLLIYFLNILVRKTIGI